ncbi:2-epi-5-epi-valiolone synthase [Kitasatospora purpeofusca]|uniref:3-dehydroquinate synthase family protein n=1 Tax=Kitasatospora purpeofusca TaxID=67352 RepID=UPI002A59E7B9|nr:2-epi-5-epi-valiolone synthase [Kitasatospora purpeofusca]MDY0815796.1 2-epi-5-epi-valiolone synthase [Kitasatospora purpeofusca]
MNVPRTQDGPAPAEPPPATAATVAAPGGPAPGDPAPEGRAPGGPARPGLRFVPGLLDPGNPALARAGGPRGRRLVVVDARVHELHGHRLHHYLDARGVDHETLVLPGREQVRTMDAVFQVADRMDSFGTSRRGAPVLAVGGGTLAQVVGLACTLYRRSTPCVRIPTTLHGLVAHRPEVETLVDPAFLVTLGRRHVAGGLAEVLKVALIADADLFGLLERRGRDLLDTRFQAAGIGAAVLAGVVGGRAEARTGAGAGGGQERPRHYGHTFSPTLETRALPKLLHGEAVCLDMALTTAVARRRGLVDAEQAERVLRLMRRLELPVWHPLLESIALGEALGGALADAAQRRDGRRWLPLPSGIGAGVLVDDLGGPELVGAAWWLRAWSAMAAGGCGPAVDG